jgi:hypothetical protein
MKQNYATCVDFLDKDTFIQLTHDFMAESYEEAALKAEKWGISQYPDNFIQVSHVVSLDAV